MSGKTQTTRERILQASLDLLEQSGGQGVRISDIAKRAGISRQALYLHFASRVELLIAATHYFDDLKGTNARLSKSRAATSGIARIDAFIEAWGSYIPEIYGIAKALIAMGEHDEAAKETWGQRMMDMREGCRAAVDALAMDGHLNPAHDPDEATDILWTLLSVQNWESWTHHCGWSQERYINNVKLMAKRLLIKN